MLLASKLILTSLTTLVTTTLTAQELPWTLQDVYSEAASEAAKCVAYYAVVDRCSKNSGAPLLATEAHEASSNASRLQVVFGAVSGMSHKAILASLQLALTAEMEEVEGSCVNMSVLLLRDGNFCKAFLENPSARLAILKLGPPLERSK